MVCGYIEASESTVLYRKNQTGLQYLKASKMTMVSGEPQMKFWQPQTSCSSPYLSVVTMVHDLNGRNTLHGRHQTPPLRFTWTTQVAAALRLSCQSRKCNLLAACSVYIIFSSWYMLWYHESCPIVHPVPFLFSYHNPNAAFCPCQAYDF